MSNSNLPITTELYVRLVANGMHATGHVATAAEHNEHNPHAPTTADYVVRSAFTSLADLTAAVLRIPGASFVKAQPSPRPVNNGSGAEVHFNIVSKAA